MRDDELHPNLEKGWTSFASCCECTPGDYHGEDSYEHTKEKLRAPYTWMEEVHLVALEDRSGYCSEAHFSVCGYINQDVPRTHVSREGKGVP